MTTRALSPRQLSIALAVIDAQITAVRKSLAVLDSAFGDTVGTLTITEEIGDAWNALHDAETALVEERRIVALNPRPIPAAEAGTWALVQQNID